MPNEGENVVPKPSLKAAKKYPLKEALAALNRKIESLQQKKQQQARTRMIRAPGDLIKADAEYEAEVLSDQINALGAFRRTLRRIASKSE